jgi:hypothetical protein
VDKTWEKWNEKDPYMKCVVEFEKKTLYIERERLCVYIYIYVVQLGVELLSNI